MFNLLKLTAMAHPVTPFTPLLQQNPQPDTHDELEGWASLPCDLLCRISLLLDSKYDIPCLLATCQSWHSSLKAALTSLRLQYFGDPALYIRFSSLRFIDASLLRRTSFGLPYLVPIWRFEKLVLSFHTVTSLNLSGQDLGSNGLHSLMSMSPRLQHLDCSRCRLNCVDMSTLMGLSNLRSLVLNGIRPSPRTPIPGDPATVLGFFFATKVLLGLPLLRRLELCREEQLVVASGDSHGVQPQAPGGPAAPQGPRVEVVGIPIYKMARELAILKQLSCLILGRQELDAADIEALASMTSLTQLAFTWQANVPSLRLNAAVWNTLIIGPTGRNLRILDVDLVGSDVRERLSLAPLRQQLQALRLRRCHSAGLLLSLMGRVVPAAAGAAAASGARASGGGNGGAVHRPAGNNGGGGDGSCGLVQLEVLEAGEHITPALVAQVCSRLPSLRVLDVSRCFRSRPRFQLSGDLFVRDLAILCPLISKLVLDGVPLHGVGFPDGRDLTLLPFVSSETEPRARGAALGRLAGASTSSSSAPSGASAAAFTSSASTSAAAAASTLSAACASAEMVQLPFPRLSSLVVQGGPSFMKSRFRSFANLTALRQLRIEGMTEKDFLATCKMGCYEALSRLSALTALQILAPPQPLVQSQPQPQAPGAAAAAPEGAPPGAAAGAGGGAAPLQVAGVGPQGGALAGFAAAQGGGAGGAGGGGAGAGPSTGANRQSAARMRPEPHLNFITELGTLRILTLEVLTTRGRVFSYLAQLPHLRELSLAGCIDLSADGLDTLRMSCMSGLRSLRMLGCVWESGEEGVDAWSLFSCLPKTTPSLEELELGASTGITAQRLSGLLEQPPTQAGAAAAAAAAAGVGAAPSQQQLSAAAASCAALQRIPFSAAAAAAAAAVAAVGRSVVVGDGPGGQSDMVASAGALKRLRYIRLYDSSVTPDAVLTEQVQMALSSSSNLRFLDFVETSPEGYSFVLVRRAGGFQLVTPEWERLVGDLEWRRRRQGYGREVGYGFEAGLDALEDWTSK